MLFVQVSGPEKETRSRILWLKVFNQHPKMTKNQQNAKLTKFTSDITVGQLFASWGPTGVQT